MFPFGLCLFPYFFGKLLRCVVEHLRQLGIRICLFVHDCLLMSTSAEINDNENVLLATLNKLGIIVNREKSSLNPERSKVYLGYNISTTGEPTISIRRI